MFHPPAIGDRFAYPNTDHPIGVIERVTKTSDGTIWLWCGEWRYPWNKCEPSGVWQALALEFVTDLSNCASYTQVTALLGALEDTDRQTIWNACPPAVRARIHELKKQSNETKPVPFNGKTKNTQIPQRVALPTLQGGKPLYQHSSNLAGAKPQPRARARG